MKDKIVLLLIAVLVIFLAAFIGWEVSAWRHQKAALRNTMAKPSPVWIARYGDGMDSRQAFSIASIIEEMRKKEAEKPERRTEDVD